MDPDRWQRLEDLFHAALELPPEEWDAYLGEEEQDATLRAEVLRLLEADADPETLDPGAAQRVAELAGEAGATGQPPPSLEGRQIGPYRVIRRVGEGGMGVVYLAERDDVDRQVALKVVRGALGAPELVRRFLRERRVLAQLDHPNIARLLDAGFTDDETPYFAMEHVEGQPITEHCQRVSASTEAKLRLFMDVCAAVSDAHARLVVHRDIKPSNVMVTQDGTVKLLDFGIAKLLDEEEDEDGTLTRTGVRVMSPAYAAPEQTQGGAITTATDVYGLGVLLRELLTGEREPGAGAPLTGDLAAICLRAAAPEPERRYRSAEQLGDDVARHLDGRPVEARLPTLRYRTGKFLRRHAGAVTAGMALFLSLGGGLGVALWQGELADRARAEAEDARREAEIALARSETVTEFLTDLFEAADPRQAQGEEVTAAELVDRGVKRVGELEDDPPLQAQILQTLATVNLELGRYTEASSLMGRAVAIRRELPPDENFVYALNVWGRTVSDRGLPDSAAAIWTEALERSEELLGEEHGNTLAAINNLAVVYGRLGRDEESEALLERLVEVEGRVLEPDDQARTYALNNLGLQMTTRGAYEEAEPLLRESLRIRRAVHEDDHPYLGMAMDNLGMMLREAGRYAEAEPLLREGMEIRRRALGAEHRYFGESLYALGTLLALGAGPGELAEADSLLHRGLEIYRTTLGPDHPGTAYLLHSLGILEEQQGDLARAEERFRQALEIRRGSSRDSPMVTVTTMSRLAGVLRRRGAHDEAVELAREAFTLADETLQETHPVRGEAQAVFGLARAAAGDLQAGAESFRAGLATVTNQIGPTHPTARRLCADGESVGVPGTAELEACRGA